MEVITVLLIILSTAFLTLGSVALKMAEKLNASVEKVKNELHAALEGLQKLHNEGVVEMSTIKKDISDLKLVNGNIKEMKK